MRRLALVALISVGVVLGHQGAAQATPPGPTPDVRAETCRYQSANERRTWSPWEVQMTMVCAVRAWGVDRGTFFAIAERESNLLPWVRNSYSGACGLFQWLPDVWAGVRHLARLHGGPWGHSCTNARSNALAAAHYVHIAGWSPWA